MFQLLFIFLPLVSYIPSGDHLPHHSNDEQPNGNAHVVQKTRLKILHSFSGGDEYQGITPSTYWNRYIYEMYFPFIHFSSHSIIFWFFKAIPFTQSICFMVCHFSLYPGPNNFLNCLFRKKIKYVFLSFQKIKKSTESVYLQWPHTSNTTPDYHSAVHFSMTRSRTNEFSSWNVRTKILLSEDERVAGNPFRHFYTFA